MSEPLPHRLERTVEIGAPPAAVFRYFTDSARWAAWWGAGSEIDPRPGGALLIRHPNGIEVVGEVVEVAPPERIVFTQTYRDPAAVPSRVTIRLAAVSAGTRLTLTHEFADEAARDQHVQGWRYQLAVFANTVADAVHADAAERVDAWFAAWSEADAAVRASLLARVASPGIRFGDRYSLTVGLDDLQAHLAAARRFMPGVRLVREGAPAQCLGTVVADWIARNAEDRELGRGTNVFVLDAEGRFASVTGLWR